MYVICLHVVPVFCCCACILLLCLYSVVVPVFCPVRHTHAQCLTMYFVFCLCAVRDREQWVLGSGGTANTATLGEGDC